ncbi:MAG: hypothetical protein EA351_03655 [Gemmatimonadales bacterium]|nr:MAG: hypothetical protein EA351_03655 [Gemmatimonadales bacterium]
MVAWTPSVDGQWVTAPGEGWVDVGTFYHDTRESYDHTGTRKEIFADGHARTLSVFTTLNVGILRGLDVWAQVPFHHLRFDDLARERTSSGLGDPKFFVRISPELFRGASLPLPVALRGGVKLAGGDFDVDAEIIPLGEGQRDLELMLELGHSLYPRPYWVAGWIGHRWRDPNFEARRRPGNEWFWYAALGADFGTISAQLAGEGLSSDPWMIDGLLLETARREMVQLLPRVGIEVQGGDAYVGARVPIRGQNLPAGAAVTFGYFRTLSLW